MTALVLVQLSDLHVRPPGLPAHRVVETAMLVEWAMRSVAAMRPRPALPDAAIVSHTVFVESFPGPFPYLLDRDYPGQADRGQRRNFARRPVVSLAS